MGEALGGWQIQILIGVTNSLFLIIIGEEETQILISYRMKIEIPSFNENLDIKSFLY